MADAIVVDGLTKVYDGRRVVDSLSLSVPEGCVYGFLGRNGAGKSTTIKLLMGLICPDGGRCELLGEDSQRLSPATLERVAYLAEGHPLYRWMSIRAMAGLASSFYRRWNAALLRDILSHFALDPRRRIGKLSNGQRAQVSLALAVAAEPELLILDDPTLGLDPVVRRDFLESMLKIIAQPGRTILFSSHILSDVERVADRVGILVDGVLRVTDRTERFKERVKRLILTFDGPPPLPPPWDDLASATVEGQDLILVVTDWQPGAESRLEPLGARHLEIEPLGLEEAFVAYTRGTPTGLPIFASKPGEPQ
jgi:ABC-2 type transport system ATP-binding protein